MSAKKLVVSTYLQYILIGVGIFLLVTLVPQISGVLLTFLMAGILAYVLNPLVRGLEKWRVPRSVGVIGVFTVLIVAVIAAMLVIIIPAVNQVQTLIAQPSKVVNAATEVVVWARSLPYVGEYVPAALDEEARTALLQFIQSNIPPASTILRGALGFIGGVFGVFGTILNLLLMLIVSIYLLLDRERILQSVLGVIPVTVRDQVLELFGAVEGSLMRYLKAQLFLCVIMGVIGWAIVFFFGGEFAHRYAMVIGVWVGITELIPVLGAFLGAIPAVILALVDSPGQALLVAILFLVAQQVEGNLLVPRIMGGSVGVHPLWVMFAMLSATALYGLVGALFAVPIVAIIAACLRYLHGTLVFERWGTAPVSELGESRDKGSVPAETGARGKQALEGE